MPTWSDDDALMADLGQAVRGQGEVTDRAAEAARAAFAWRTMDEELMALAHDSAVEQGLLVRGVAAAARVVSFEVADLSLEVEIDRGDLMGQVLPGQACVITVQAPGAAQRRVEVDESGFFTLPALGPGLVRFLIEAGTRRTTTEWLTL